MGIILDQNIMVENISLSQNLREFFNFQRECLAKSLAKLHFSMRAFLPFNNFQRDFWQKKKKKSKSLKILQENNPSIEFNK